MCNVSRVTCHLSHVTCHQTCNSSRLHGYYYPCKIYIFWCKFLRWTYGVLPKIVFCHILWYILREGIWNGRKSQRFDYWHKDNKDKDMIFNSVVVRKSHFLWCQKYIVKVFWLINEEVFWSWNIFNFNKFMLCIWKVSQSSWIVSNHVTHSKPDNMGLKTS